MIKPASSLVVSLGKEFNGIFKCLGSGNLIRRWKDHFTFS